MDTGLSYMDRNDFSHDVEKVLVEKKDKKTAQATLQVAMKEIDKAAGKKVIHSGTASRKISRLSKAVATIA